MAAIATARATSEEDLAALADRLGAQRLELDVREGEAVVAISTLDRQVAALTALVDANASAHDTLLQTDATLTQARAALERARDVATRLEAEIVAFERTRAEFRQRQFERENLEIAEAAFADELTVWQAFARIFGKEGLPVLEIDAAGPGVSAQANDLLQACFGARFTVELITQDTKVDGSGFKEVFELRVYDSERGGAAKDLGLYSGGEQVIIDEALKSAIALFVNQRNVRPIRTCWRDETTGALDPDNALRYVQMLRRVRERGGFSQVLFISHNPEAAAQADVQLVFGAGRIDVRYPPFAEVA